MSDIQGKFISFEPSMQAEKKAGGTYNAWRIIYEDGFGAVKNITKPAGTLLHTPGLKNGLERLVSGDSFVMERQEKDGFQNPVKVYKSEGAAQQAQPIAKAAAPAPTGPNTFEVNNQLKEKQMKLDEIRQPLIVRQTCLKAAAELAVLFKFKTEEEVLQQAKRFIAFVETGNTGSIEDMPNDDIDIS